MFSRFTRSNAAVSQGSPRVNRGFTDINNSNPSTPSSRTSYGYESNSSPQSPRVNIVYPISSKDSAGSLSASRKFDWEAARLRKPPPYPDPLHGARQKMKRRSEAGQQATSRRAVRKMSLCERAAAIPNRIMFELSLFPDNIPLPESKKSAWVLGAVMHILNLIIILVRARKRVEEELPWADSYLERTSSWYDWATPLEFILIVAPFLVGIRLFSLTRPYYLHHCEHPVNSPNAKLVSTELIFSPLDGPPMFRRFLRWLSYQFSISWRFLFNLKPPALPVQDGTRVERVQQLDIWTPRDLELHLFPLYSPAHAFLWKLTTGSNWIMMFIIMAFIGLQAHLLIQKYEALLKDKAIIAAEVMREYNEKFVNPRVMPLRDDKCVQTHEAEIVNTSLFYKHMRMVS